MNICKNFNIRGYWLLYFGSINIHSHSEYEVYLDNFGIDQGGKYYNILQTVAWVVLHVSLIFVVFFCFVVFFFSLHELHVQCMQIYEELMQCACVSCREQKVLQKSGLHEASPKRKFVGFEES